MKKNTKIRKRVVPLLEYAVADFEDYEEVASMPQTKKVVFENVIEAITDSIRTKKAVADIFMIDRDVCVTLEKDKWASSLNSAIEFFSAEDLEDYESCKKCQELIKEIPS